MKNRSEGGHVLNCLYIRYKLKNVFVASIFLINLQFEKKIPIFADR